MPMVPLTPTICDTLSNQIPLFSSVSAEALRVHTVPGCQTPVNLARLSSETENGSQ